MNLRLRGALLLLPRDIVFWVRMGPPVKTPAVMVSPVAEPIEMMRNGHLMPGPAADALNDAAVDWLVRLHSGRATGADRDAFTAWRARSAAHEAAARDAELLWQEIGETPVAAAFRIEASGAPVVAFRHRASRPTRRAVLAGTVAASAAAIVVASGAVGPVAGLFSDYATGVGEQRRVRLPDGSTAYLNTRTALSVAFSASERRLSLKAGEAMFEVARDAARPFVVGASDGETRAVGTVFGVRRDGADVDVAVAEGVVEVSLPAVSSPPVRVAAGQGVRYAADRFVTPVQPVDVGADLAWQRGKLIFNRRPLASVVAELQRYQVGRIVVADARLRDMPVTGVFDLDDPRGTLQTIEQTLLVKVLHLPWLTVLR
ncbi:MAG TPA: FecR domain-containing protein [Rhodopila sp.]